MPFPFARLVSFKFRGQSVLCVGYRNAVGAVFMCRGYSKSNNKSGNSQTPPWEDDSGEEDHPETTAILGTLRARHHYHGNASQQAKRHDVMVIEPDYKWGRQRFKKATAQHRLEEACGLVEAISNWSVASCSVEPIRKADNKTFFGKGKTEELLQRINQAKREEESALDAVYVDIGRLSSRQHKELEALWDVKVFDRFGIVLQIFKERAQTAEAKIQVELAEIPYLRSRLVGDDSIEYDQQRGGTHYVSGGGETQLEKERRALTEREIKLKKKLESLRKHREHIRHERHKRHVPIVSVVGYTNAGKTTLIKTLTGDVKMHPDNKLFATLDVTAHTGKLPSGMQALFVDTVGFVSDLPPELVDSFSATLEDVVDSDLVVHVRDVCHPEQEAQNGDVLSVLQQLKLRPSLMNTMINVYNKIDICSTDHLQEVVPHKGPDEVLISALHGTGVDNLRKMIEDGVMKATGRMVKKVVIPPDGPQLSWLYHEATVHDTEADEDGFITATIIIDKATNNRFEKKFGKLLS